MKGEEKKLLLKRIGIFLFFAFIVNYIIGIVFADKKGGITLASLSNTMMLYPAIANIVTRVITKEGVEEHYLKANFKKNKWVYVAAVILPLLMGFGNALAMHFIFDRNTDMAAYFDGMLGEVGGMKAFIAVILTAYMKTVPLLIMGFGEEFGWRAYLTPKLEKLMPRWGACCVTGAIWAIWHAPLVWYGYDFGTDYPGFPYVGIIAMCFACIPMSYMLTEMTEKTKSIYPATICHMCIDMVMTYPLVAYVSSEAMEKNTLAMGTINLGLCPALVTVGIVCAKLIKKNKAAA